MKNALLDSDVILDFFFDRKPHSIYSSYILSRIESHKLIGYITPVIISNVYYLLRKDSTHARVIRNLNQIMTILKVLIIDKQIILKALNSNFKDFEDALQNYACESNKKIDIILTRNLKDYKNSDLGVMTPEEYYRMNVR